MALGSRSLALRRSLEDESALEPAVVAPDIDALGTVANSIQ